MDILAGVENNELRAMVNMDAEQATVDGRELHEFLKVKTAYKDWFPRMCEYGFDKEKKHEYSITTRKIGKGCRNENHHNGKVGGLMHDCGEQTQEGRWC